MLRFVADVCFNGSIFRALQRSSPLLDIVRAQDAGLNGAADPYVLAWAAEQGRLVLSHDVNTLIGYANDRTRSAQPMPGLIEVPHSMPVGRTVEDILILANCSMKASGRGKLSFCPCDLEECGKSAENWSRRQFRSTTTTILTTACPTSVPTLNRCPATCPANSRRATGSSS